MKYYDNSRLSDLKDCPRKFYFRHVRHWTSEGTSPALVFGSAWHAAMDVVWGLARESISDMDLAKAGMLQFEKVWTEEGAPSQSEIMDSPHLTKKFQQRTPLQAAEMLLAYIQERRKFISKHRIIAMEQPFIVEYDEKGMYCGKMDKIIEEVNGDILGIEHKTTALYATSGGFRKDYIDQWSPNSQVDGYMHTLRVLYGGKARRVLVDAALIHKKERKFTFIPVDRAVDGLKAFLSDLAEWVTWLRVCFEKNVWPKNTGACGNYGGCQYRSVCKFYHDPSRMEIPPPGFKVEKWEPFNELKLETLGLTAEE